jgi:hypothetical protein
MQDEQRRSRKQMLQRNTGRTKRLHNKYSTMRWMAQRPIQDSYVTSPNQNWRILLLLFHCQPRAQSLRFENTSKNTWRILPTYARTTTFLVFTHLVEIRHPKSQTVMPDLQELTILLPFKLYHLSSSFQASVMVVFHLLPYLFHC